MAAVLCWPGAARGPVGGDWSGTGWAGGGWLDGSYGFQAAHWAEGVSGAVAGVVGVVVLVAVGLLLPLLGGVLWLGGLHMLAAWCNDII